ncbi:pre-peptidase C-terminal domain-containing protein [Candidatus Leptofilum sp.]|uniref:pre-peptidase C-terminal domain-containing protein n=1 Tax=Candidatus Leptofilum sp. TaxID=3241576 RepID=UPI003B5AAE24
MIQTVALVATIILSLIVLGFALYVLVLMYREKGIGHALLGFFISPYGYFWGWFNAGRLKIIDVMIAWTVVFILSIAFPVIISVQETAKAFSAFDSSDFVLDENGDGTFVFTNSDSDLALGSEDAVLKGSIQVGGRVNDEITDLFEVHSWTFNGTAGQTVTIQGNAAGGDSTDPRVNLLGPDGNFLVGDDDTGDDNNALISSFTLPSTGQYTIQIDTWQTGRYEIVLE